MSILHRPFALRGKVAIVALLSLTAPALAEDVTIFAAASLKTALDQAAADWQAETGNAAVISYGGSSALAKQIGEGAPADLFLSAAVNWMDKLQEQKLILPDTRRDLWGNTLVLVAHGSGAPQVEIGTGFDLPGLLGDNKLSMAMVDSVPAGQYGKEALESFGLWSAVQANVVQSENVRAALDFVITGEAAFGIIYASDAIADDQAGNAVSVVGTFPADSHAPIVYPGAVIAGGHEAAAKAFLDYLSSEAADNVFREQGFAIID